MESPAVSDPSQSETDNRTLDRTTWTGLLSALFLSGVASVSNQVLWQRALRVFLGGSETLSSLVVILVFMLGLGIGAGYMGPRGWRSRHPLRLLAFVELGLFAVNSTLAWLLSLDLRESVFALQTFAMTLGIPLRLVYAVGALLVLFLPTFLMGATIPIASEALQRQMGATRASLVPKLFALNTLGAVIGAFGSSAYFLPAFGQTTSLGLAAGLNLVAAVVLFVLANRVAPVAQGDPSPGWTSGPLRHEELLGAWLGFLALGYEMFLFRLVTLVYLPLPTTFAKTLCLYLLFWSLGAFAATYLRDRLRAGLLLGALAVAAMPTLYALDRWQFHFNLLGVGLSYFLPCIAFGYAYGVLVTQAAKQWGSDVGRFSALNTLGACLGILFFTLVGYGFDQTWNAWLISIGLAIVVAHLLNQEAGTSRGRKSWRAAEVILGAAMLVVLTIALTSPVMRTEDTMTFWGRDGVIEVHKDGHVEIDGLWHTRLSNGTNHVGEPYSWLMGVAPVLAHAAGPITDALVIGNAAGLTAGTLARLPECRVDTYEINSTWRTVMELFPRGTLRTAEHPRIRIYWRDARTGMALNPKKYDVIVSAPLHLSQAGSSQLLSKEYLTLARQRLKPGGVFALHSHEGELSQALIIQRTVRSVFPHSRTVLGGRITVASDSPIQFSEESIAARLRLSDPFHQEVAAYERRLEASGKALHLFLDPETDIRLGPLLITDDQPVLEYPAVLDRLLAREIDGH
ncbi:MAG: fused MFS/spermidine synthase [Thermoanaerobaculia bacterium]|nr:fused MFS/spermidine synthase [Thermoanaerobaculia bacterium]